MIFNINTIVKIKPTALGMKILEADHYEYVKTPFITPVPDEHGYISMPLWEVMQIFGKSMYNGSKLVIETDIIIPQLNPNASVNLE